MPPHEPDLDHRRVITGLDTEGRSCVIVEGPGLPYGGGGGRLIWHNDIPADNAARADCEQVAFSFDRMEREALFIRMEFPPGMAEFWHATNSIDYVVMLEGEVTLMLETGEATLRAGDFLVDRGVVHCWRNDSGKPAVAAIVSVPALPVGKGKTV